MQTSSAAPRPEDIILGLNRLRQAWARTNAGQGGYSALSGFDFQITRAILEVVRAESSGGGLVLMEVLSDIVRQEGGLVVAQLKRTLASGTLTKALEELWAIERLARSATPELRPFIRYEVQAAQRVLKDAAGSIERWLPAGADLVELEAFKARVQVNVAAAPRLEAARLLVQNYADPRPFQTIDQYAGRLLRAPDGAGMETAAEEIRIELAALKANAADRKVDFHLWGGEDRPPQKTTLESDPRRAVRVGQRLTLGDLVAGRLADRRVYGDLHAAAEDWLRGLSDGADKIPTFWIEGRSGAGKSAALLHLLSKLLVENPQRVIVWLGSQGDRFGDAVQRFRDVIEAGEQLIIAIDDPLAPGVQDRFLAAAQVAAEVWTRLNGSGAKNADAPPPVLICCGPTEQKEFGEDRCYVELDILAWPLPKEDIQDLQELADWYEQRTGVAPPDLEGDVLLVQRFFEWNKGKIRDFALRFGERLVAFQDSDGKATVFETVSRILAFGRLYADYPATILNDVIDRDVLVARAFEQLSESETHLTFRPDGDGVRLTHPHLADAIYREWFGRPADRHARKAHLLDGFRASMGRAAMEPEIRLAPLWAIARLVRVRRIGYSASQEMRERITLIEGELAEVLPELYAELDEDTVALTDLPVWLVLDDALHLGLTPSPRSRIKACVDAATGPGKGLRLSCHVLLESSRSDPEGAGYLDAVANLLNRVVEYRDPENLPWRDWAFVAADVAYNGGHPLILDATLRFIDRAPHWRGLGIVVHAMARTAPPADAAAIGLAWLSATQDTPQYWPTVLRALQERGLASSKVGEYAYRFLLTQSRHRAWATVWEAAEVAGQIEPKKLLDLALAWLGVRHQMGFPIADIDSRGFDRMICAAYRLAANAERAELAELGLAFLRATDTAASGWSLVWSPLWAAHDLAPDIRDELRVMGLALLDGHPDTFGWSFVWHPFTKHLDGITREDLKRRALAWLRAVRPGHLGWVYVWDTLTEWLLTRLEREPLLALGEDWVTQVPDHRGWSAVWDVLVTDGGERRARALALGRNWLRLASPDHPSWGFVARQILPLVKVSDDDCARLATAGEQWLTSHLDDFAWPQVFAQVAPLLSTDRRNAFVKAALETGRRSGVLQPRLINLVVDRTEDDELRNELLRELASWLPDHLEHRDWPAAWHVVLRSNPRPMAIEDLLALVGRWSDRAGPLDYSWPYVWPTWQAVLRNEGKTSEVEVRTEDALRCLLFLPGSHKRWPNIWRTINLHRPELLVGPEVISAQKAWLRRPIHSAGLWAQVFRKHAELTADWEQDPVFGERLMDWLEAGLLADQAWPTVWKFALKVRQDQLDELQQHALGWLRASRKANRSWQFVWRLCVTAPNARRNAPEELFSLAEQWLFETSPTDRNWHMVLSTVRQYASHRDWSDDFVSQQVQRLQTYPAGEDALRIWNFLERARPQAAAMVGVNTFAALVEGLDLHERRWKAVWTKYIESASAEDRSAILGSRAVEWLRGPGQGDTSWPWVWRDVWEGWKCQHQAVRSLGHQWLRGRPINTPGRNLVQTKLFPSKVQKQKRKTPEA